MAGFLFKTLFSPIMVIRMRHRRLTYENDGQNSPKKPGQIRRRTIYVLVNLCVACVKRHIGFGHGYRFVFNVVNQGITVYNAQYTHLLYNLSTMHC